MSSWEEKTVGEICNVKGGKRLPAGKDFADGVTAFPYLRVTDMTNGSIDQTSLVYVTPEIEPFIRNYKISKNDLYVTIAGTLGLFGTIPDNLDNAQLTENAAKLCEINFLEFNKLFLKYYFNSENTQAQIWREIGVGGGVPKLALFRIEKLVVKYPQKKIQDNIAKILSTADAVIEKTQSAIAKYKAIKQGMLDDLFTRGIDITTSKLRLRYDDAPELYKESKLGWIPKEWDVKEFGKEVDLIHGHQFRDYDFTEFGIPVVKIGQVKPENIDLRNCSFVNFGREEEFKNEIIGNGDVLMALTGATLGKACLVKGLNGIVYQNYRVGRFEPIIKDNDIDKEFLYYLLIAGELLAQIFNKVNSGAQGNVGKADFEKATFKKPPFKEQKIMAKRLITIDNKLQTEQNYLQKMQQLKQGLMGDLLSGLKEVRI